MARELIRLKGEGKPTRVAGGGQTPALLGAIAATLVVAFGAYWYLGSPDMPAAPIASRPEAAMTVEEAVARIEAQLQQTPDDVRGWRTIAPAYMQLRRFADAEAAYRRVLEIEGATADNETNLAEAIMMKQSGAVDGEPLELLASAAARDPAHVRSRFYLAAESTQAGEYETAVKQWNELFALSKGDEPWLETARQGLAAATAGLNGDNAPGEAEILAMVEGLAARLASDGGTVDEWTRLVRSRLVLGQTAEAQAAYDAARAAYPDAAVRTELDVLAADNGLVAN
jgi:cytochrome c-type biogenesis protein CcmH